MTYCSERSSTIFQAGSNTISMFAINPHNPLDLKMVGEPINSGGDFPVSVDMNPKMGIGK
jgi:hypothetical protein